MAYKRELHGEKQVTLKEASMDDLSDYVANLNDSATLREREVALKNILTLARRGSLARRHTGQTEHQSVVADAIMQALAEPRKAAPHSETLIAARIAAAIVLTGDVEDDGDFAVAAVEALAPHVVAALAAASPDSDEEDENDDETPSPTDNATDDCVLLTHTLTVLHAFSHDYAVQFPGTKQPLEEFLLNNVNFDAIATRVAIAVARYVALWLEPSTAPVDNLIALVNDNLRPRAIGGNQKDVVAFVGLLEVIHGRFGSDASASIEDINVADITGPTKAARAALTRYERLQQTQELPPITITFDTDVKVFLRQATATTSLTTVFSQSILASVQAVLGSDGIDANHLFPVYHYFLGDLDVHDFHYKQRFEDTKEVQRARGQKEKNRSRNKDREDKSSRQDYAE